MAKKTTNPDPIPEIEVMNHYIYRNGNQLFKLTAEEMKGLDAYVKLIEFSREMMTVVKKVGL